MKRTLTILLFSACVLGFGQNESFTVDRLNGYGVTVEIYEADTLNSTEKHDIQAHWTTGDNGKTLFLTEVGKDDYKHISQFSILSQDEDTEAVHLKVRSEAEEEIDLYFFKNTVEPTVGYIYPNRDYYIVTYGKIQF